MQKAGGMKRSLLLAGLLLAPWIVQAADNFQVSVLRKKADAIRAKAARPGEEITATETVFYQVTVANRAFKETGAVTARYILFVERQELGVKAGSEQIDKEKGENAVEALKPQGKVSFNTSEITLREQSLSGGNFIYLNGGRIKAKDSLVGIWVKLFEGETQVGEYINPSTLSNKYKWN